MGFAMFLCGLGVEFVAYVLVVLLHEFCHAEVAERLGYQLHTIRLMPYGASLTGQFDIIKCKDEILIALAGPLINLAIAILIVAVWWIWPVTYVYSEALLIANFAIFVINLCPIYPLDGGRILLAILSRHYKRQRAYAVFRLIGIVVAFVLLCICVVAIANGVNITIALISGFVFLTSIFPDKSNKYQRLYSIAYRTDKITKGIQLRDIVITKHTTLRQAFRMLNSQYYHRYTIVDNGQVVSVLFEHQLESLALNNDYDSTIGQAMSPSTYEKTL
jgi:stage IV sporulation protein FB